MTCAKAKTDTCHRSRLVFGSVAGKQIRILPVKHLLVASDQESRGESANFKVVGRSVEKPSPTQKNVHAFVFSSLRVPARHQ